MFTTGKSVTAMYRFWSKYFACVFRQVEQLQKALTVTKGNIGQDPLIINTYKQAKLHVVQSGGWLISFLMHAY